MAFFTILLLKKRMNPVSPISGVFLLYLHIDLVALVLERLL